MKTAVLLPFVILATLQGCSTERNDMQTLDQDLTYRVEWIGERPLIDRSYLSVSFDAESRRAHGNAGCNNWFGGYVEENGQLRFERIASSRKMCAPALMEQEQRYLAALAEVTHWDFSPIGQLQLWPREGQPIRLWPENEQ